MDSAVEQNRTIGAASFALAELLAVSMPDSSLQHGGVALGRSCLF